MLSRTGKVFLCGILILAAGHPVFGDQRRVVTAENPQFEIVGLHARSVSYVDELSQHVVQVAARYLDREGLQFPQRILVSLKPEDFVEFEGVYSVRYGERGFVNLDLRWDESLDLLTTCRALTDALMVRYSFYNYGQSGPEILQEWPVTAIGVQAYLSLRPAQSQRVSDWLDPSATPEIGALLQRRRAEPVGDANGYGLLRAMEDYGLERRQVRGLFAQSIAGADIRPLLTELIQQQDPEVEAMDLDDWWRASLSQLLVQPEDLMETMAASRAWIEALADFSEVDEKELSLKQIWEERENPQVRELMEARFELIKLRIIRVNPAYFNSARSLGALYEICLVGERRHKFMHQLAVFLSDFEDAKVLEDAVLENLSQAGAEAGDE